MRWQDRPTLRSSLTILSTASSLPRPKWSNRQSCCSGSRCSMQNTYPLKKTNTSIFTKEWVKVWNNPFRAETHYTHGLVKELITLNMYAVLNQSEWWLKAQHASITASQLWAVRQCSWNDTSLYTRSPHKHMRIHTHLRRNTHLHSYGDKSTIMRIKEVTEERWLTIGVIS